MTTRAQHTSSFAALGRLLRYARGYRRQIIAATTCSIINKLFDIAPPEILIGVAIDVVVNQEESFVAGLGFETAQEQITILAVLTFFIWLVSRCLSTCSRFSGATWPSDCSPISDKTLTNTPSVWT